MITILGISAFYHDSADCLVQDGAKVVISKEHERLRNLIRFLTEFILSEK
jgi:predicted NodU family carbamoyl transferase